MNKDHLSNAVILFGVGIAIFLTDGFGFSFIRNYLGDVVAVLFLFSFMSVFWRRSLWARVFVVGGIAFGIELLQVFVSGSTAIEKLLFGTTFDFGDMVAYTFALLFILLAHHKQIFRSRGLERS